MGVLTKKLRPRKRVVVMGRGAGGAGVVWLRSGAIPNERGISISRGAPKR